MQILHCIYLKKSSSTRLDIERNVEKYKYLNKCDTLNIISLLFLFCLISMREGYSFFPS